jgi:hypothetical protein
VCNEISFSDLCFTSVLQQQKRISLFLVGIFSLPCFNVRVSVYILDVPTVCVWCNGTKTKRGNVRTHVTRRRVRVIMLLWRGNHYYALCVCLSVGLVIQHAEGMSLVVLPSVACLAVPYFSTLSHKRHGLRKTLLKIKYVLIFCTTFTCNIFHSKNTSTTNCHKCTNVFKWSTCYSCRILFSRQSFEK